MARFTPGAFQRPAKEAAGHSCLGCVLEGSTSGVPYPLVRYNPPYGGIIRSLSHEITTRSSRSDSIEDGR